MGDVLVIKCGDQSIEKEVKKVENFASVDELIQSAGLAAVMPLAKDVESAKKVWYSFPGYKAKIDQYGLVA